jgi:thiamine-monophosphate kinase
MLVKEIGEFGLIDRISRMLPLSSPDVVVGIGDDVAVLKTSGPDYLLATCDTQTEGVHFIRDAITPYQLGRKAVAINVSDIAAMGGNPSWVLVSLAMPEATDVAFIEDLYRGMCEQAALAGAFIVGGNLSRLGSGLVVDITLLGQIAPEHLVLRSGAQVGDSIFVTGFPGESRAGLELVLRPELRVQDPFRKKVLERHLTPQPRLREGQCLARSGLAHAMIDVSDGVLADLGHICDASGTGAHILADSIPVSEAAAEVCSAAGRDVLDWILTGGEDYELLFTADSGTATEIRKTLLDETGLPCHLIGHITDQAGTIRIGNGERVFPNSGARGWDHFGGSKV